MPQAAPLLGQEVPAGLQPGGMGSEPHIGSALPGTALASPAREDRVTIADLQDDPKAAIAKIGALLKRDVSDPHTWVSLLAGYFGPKILQGLMPNQAIGSAPAGGSPAAEGSAPSPAPTGPSPMGAAVRAAVPRMVNAVVGYRGKEAYGAVREGVSAARAARASSSPAPASPAPATAAPEAAPVSPAPPPPPVAPAAAPSAPARTATMGSQADLIQLQGEFHRLVARGMSKEDALALIDKQLALQQRLGGPSLEAVRRAVQFRNEKNRWPE